MNVKWLIEEAAFPEDVAPLMEALKEIGLEYKKANYFQLEDALSAFAEDECVVFIGSLGLAKQLRRKAKWIPGVYYARDKYECHHYYAYLGEHLFNANYAIVPFGDLLRRKEFFYNCFGQDRTIFIRPDRGDKPFVGQLIYKENFEKDVDRFSWGKMEPEELIVVAEPQNIKNEWRFVVVNSKVVAGSEYKFGNRVGSKAEYPQAAYDFAAKIATIYNPDIVWIVDVCLTMNDEYKVMEVGCFSCAGLYQCDRRAIVKSVSAAAWEEWKSYHLYQLY